MVIAIVRGKDVLDGFCIVQLLQTMTDMNGTVMLTEFECPILSLEPTLFFVESYHVCKPISVVHVCSPTCRMNNQKFIHDYTNNLYCFNIFCTGNY